ncbi:MAG: hypothetical protein QMD46_05005 [Methanomicrobiales archaeon]|nr:hypothetical protein [Methanomicrobiales archaeon]MDI6877556.1 hypothetical protein [Methanomicrobiales archaeon]
MTVVPQRQGVRVIDIRPVVDLTETEKRARHAARGCPPLGRFERIDPCTWWERKEEIERIQREREDCPR